MVRMAGSPTGFFHDVSAAALAHPGVTTGPMMGFPCLRVAELVGSGVGKPFAPAGRTFREWILVDDRDETRWAELVEEAREFVSGHPWPGRSGRGAAPRGAWRAARGRPVRRSPTPPDRGSS